LWIAGYGGDVWNEQPAPKDHPWRYMPSQAMTPHISGTTLDAQAWAHLPSSLIPDAILTLQHFRKNKSSLFL